MNLSGIDLNLFVVFDTIYEERNLTRASEILHITQPAISNALARLRTAFGDPLFVRTGRTMTPSPLAQSLVGPVRNALRQLRTSIDQSRSFDPLASSRLFNVAVRDTACLELMPGLMARLAQAAPGIRIHCHELDRRDIPAELASGQLDLAIDIPELARSDLHNVGLVRDRYVCVLRRDHPAASRPFDLACFLGLRHVMVSGRRRGRGLVDIALGRLGLQTDTMLRLTHFQPAVHVVMRTDMAVCAPLSLARRYEVAIRELPFAVAPLESMLYWHRNADLDPANVWMRRQIQVSCASDRADARENAARKRRRPPSPR